MLAAGTAAHADPRIASHLYQPSEVVTIHGRGDTQSTIAFAPDERIENVAVGDSAGWQVAPNKRADLLFLKPIKPGARTNMTVVTDQRTYLFDLISTPRAEPVYMLRFTYPAVHRPAPVAAVPAAPVVVAEAKPIEPDPSTLNFAWASRGDKALLPSRVFDDGHSTFLAWPADVPLPAILATEAPGIEGPVNYTTRGNYIVVDDVPAQLILRSGKQMATLKPADAQPAADRHARKARREAAPAVFAPPSASLASNAQ
ncbi:TrbG/VirB9 family P-type conjugative transfer protein [Sphingosinicellaceae bacterium]|nr:TrbG/VirB9 family P-type conjugative transfer protein [Sphingosinicellaceae bacterium]